MTSGKQKVIKQHVQKVEHKIKKEYHGKIEERKELASNLKDPTKLALTMYKQLYSTIDITEQ